MSQKLMYRDKIITKLHSSKTNEGQTIPKLAWWAVVIVQVKGYCPGDRETPDLATAVFSWSIS